MPLSPYDWLRFPFFLMLHGFIFMKCHNWMQRASIYVVCDWNLSIIPPSSPPVFGRPNMQLFAIDKVYPSLRKNIRWFTFSSQIHSYFVSREINRWWIFGKEKRRLFWTGMRQSLDDPPARCSEVTVGRPVAWGLPAAHRYTSLRDRVRHEVVL